MTDLGELLDRLGLSQYLERLVDEGFEKWEAVMDITEQDLGFLNFKLGHRRILQREIASARGIPPHQALTSIPPIYPAEDVEDERLSPKEHPSSKSDPGKGGIPPTGKRKYRRHPKPDERAPEKPPSAYVMFANRVRDELKGQNLSFTDIAKLVGEKWKVLDPEHKETYELEASIAKEKYNSEMQEYKKTESYREYIQYLSDFRSKLGKEGREGSVEQAEANRKRPKIEGQTSSAGGVFASTVSSSGSLNSGISATAPFLSGIGRTGGAGSGTATSSEQSAYASPSGHDSSNAFHHMNVQSVSPSAAKPVAISPPRRSRSPSDVARYRDAVLRTTQQQQQEALVAPTADAEPSFFPRIHPTIQSPHIQQQSSFLRHQPPPIGAQPLSRPGPPIPNPAMRRSSVRSDDVLPPTPASISSSGSSTAPSLTPSMSNFDDGGRSHRSLPSLPPPTPGPTTGPGYFDQRPHHPQPPPPPSPRQFSHHQSFPPPTPMGHPSHSSYHGYQSASQLPTINQATHDTSNMLTSTSRETHSSSLNQKPPPGR
ncbi:hypothetical protein P167DRAFT_553722 [Morchella conica CCBAS932]|uniref:HMG box domain-containing protein n=1 Tax=Morchella conica CCBAS932 TaxID=1392247 RepID=A0A3N4KUT1_9PEZI|nr:hypothetical protein P167DRAFT_553722 [Morchella conica CCBAS932]